MSDHKETRSDEDRRGAEKEKSYMIPLMGMIYEGATTLLICHDGNFKAELPVDMQPELLPKAELPIDERPEPLQRAIDAMKEGWRVLEWHRRMWTFQEGVLGKRYETMLGGLSQPVNLEKVDLWSRPKPHPEWTKYGGRRGSITNPVEQGHLIWIPEGRPAYREKLKCTLKDFLCAVDPDRRRRPLALLMFEVAGRDCHCGEDTLYALWAVALQDLRQPVPGKMRGDIIQSLTTIGAIGMEVLVGPIGEDTGTGCWVPEHPLNCESWTTPRPSALVPAFVDGAWVAIGTMTIPNSQFSGDLSEPANAIVMMLFGGALGPRDETVSGEAYTNILKLGAEDHEENDLTWNFQWEAVGSNYGHLMGVKRLEIPQDD